MVEQPLYVKLIAWLSGLVPAILGSAISLKLATDTATPVSRTFSFFSGIVLAHYFGWAIVEYFNIQVESMVASSILFVVGLFGVTTASEISKQLPELIKGISDKILESFDKVLSFFTKK